MPVFNLEYIEEELEGKLLIKSNFEVSSYIIVIECYNPISGVGFDDEKSLLMSQMSLEKKFGQSCWTTSEKPISVYVSGIRGLPF